MPCRTFEADTRFPGVRDCWLCCSRRFSPSKLLGVLAARISGTTIDAIAEFLLGRADLD
jgi:hypothetical protein